MPAVAVTTARSPRLARPGGKGVGNGLIGAAVVFATLLERVSWQLVAYAALGAMLIVCTAAMVIGFVMTSPEESVRRRQAGLE